MDALQVIEDQIKGLEEAARTADADQKIKIAQTIAELIKSQSGLLALKSVENAIREEFKGLSEEEVVFIRELDQQKIMSMDASFFDEDDDDQSYHETIASSTNIEEEANVNIQHEMLAGLIRMIPDSDTRDIMLMHLGMYGSGAVYSNKSIALIKHRKESEIIAIINSTEHELCRWQAIHNKMSGNK